MMTVGPSLQRSLVGSRGTQPESSSFCSNARIRSSTQWWSSHPLQRSREQAVVLEDSCIVDGFTGWGLGIRYFSVSFIIEGRSLEGFRFGSEKRDVFHYRLD